MKRFFANILILPIRFYQCCISPLFPPTMQLTAPFATLFFQAGKKEKISRGDILGFISNNGGIEGKEIGAIDLRDHYALVAVPADKAEDILARIAKLKIKNKRVRISLAII